MIREIVESDFEAVVSINAAEVRHTSAMDLARFRFLAGLSAYRKLARIDGEVAAFLIALRENAPYENENHRWFRRRFPTYLYVDRIVVAGPFAGRGIGRALYRDLFAFARSQRVAAVTCEYNIEPPNPASKAFHDRFGFREIGTQWVAGGTRRVSLQAADIDDPRTKEESP